MWIKKLKLENFQRHEHLNLVFTEGVNTIVGKTDVGKSTIVRAIRWIFFPSELRGFVVMRENAKRTSVEIELNDGIAIKRIKTATVNSYELTINKETKVYNATSNIVPEDILKITKIIPIEIDNNRIILNIANKYNQPASDSSGAGRTFFN